MKEKKKDKGLFFGIILLLALLGYIIYTMILNGEMYIDINNILQKNNVSNNLVSFVYESRNLSAEGNIVSDIYGVDKFGNIKKIVSNVSVMYDVMDISNGVLYYVGNDDNLYSLSLNETSESRNLNLKIDKEALSIFVDDNIIYIFGFIEETNSFFNKMININTKEEISLPFIANSNTKYFINNKIYYTQENDNSLNYYDIKTKNNKLISNESYIIYTDNNYIVYIKDEQELYMYDIFSETSKLVKKGDFLSFNSDHITVDRNSMYFIEDKKLYKYYKGKLKDLVTFNNNENETTDISMFKINDNQLLILVHNYNIETECFEVCEGGTKKSYFYNLRANKLEDIINDYSSLDERHLDDAYVKYYK